MAPNCSCMPDMSCTTANTSFGIISEVLSGGIDMILHVGDFAYNMGSANGFVGDMFFDLIQPFATRVPYMVSVGNHEGGGADLARYTESFRHMPTTTKPVTTVNTTNGLAPNNW